MFSREICRSSQNGEDGVKPFIEHLAQGYLEICKAKKPEERDLTEFFGLRDFYRYVCFQLPVASHDTGVITILYLSLDRGVLLLE